MKWHQEWECLKTFEYADIYRLRWTLTGFTFSADAEMKVLQDCLSLLPPAKRQELVLQATLLTMMHHKERCDMALRQRE